MGYAISVAQNRGGFNRDNLTDKDAASAVLFPINQAALTFSEAPGGLVVSLKTMTPNFKTFMVRVDDGEWKENDDKLAWNLHPGKNTLEAKSVNLFGVDGYIIHSVITICAWTSSLLYWEQSGGAHATAGDTGCGYHADRGAAGDPAFGGVAI